MRQRRRTRRARGWAVGVRHPRRGPGAPMTTHGSSDRLPPQGRPALAPVPDRCLDTSGGPKADPDRSGGLSAAGAVTLASRAVRHCSKLRAFPSTPGLITPTNRWQFVRGLNSPARLRPKAPSCLSYSAILLSSRRVRFGFRLSCLGRRSREAIRFRSRCLENARVGRVGQGRERRLIHFAAKCQWTRVDKSTACRKA